jgi:phage/plasmid-associated DNA primase
LPFTHKPKVVDRYLKGILTAKEASIGILAWAVEGCVRWHREGLHIPSVVEASTRALQEEMNPLSEFIADYFETEPAAFIPVAEIIFSYDRWCKASGQRFPLNKRAFNRNMETLGFRQELRYVAGKRMRCWIGLKSKGLDRIPANELPYALPLDSLLERSEPTESKSKEKQAPTPGGLQESAQTLPRVADDDEAFFKQLAEDD